MTLLISHDACLDHDTTANHPEHPDRLRAIDAALASPEFDGLTRKQAPLATQEQIERAHPKGHRSKSAIAT